jgi:hypothetical protein
MNSLRQYIEARRITGTNDDAPPTEPFVSRFPLDENDEFEPTIPNCEGIPEEAEP